MAILGYVRVAHKDPDSIGRLSQESKILQKSSLIDTMYIDEGFSAFSFKPSLQKMMDTMVKGDTIIITRLDRISKNYEQIKVFFEELELKGIRLVITKSMYDTDERGYEELIFPIRNGIYLNIY